MKVLSGCTAPDSGGAKSLSVEQMEHSWPKFVRVKDAKLEMIIRGGGY